MEKEFIPYEQALALKELGFDEPCLAIYSFKDLRIGIFSNLSSAYNTILAPLYQQAFRWFREKYDIVSFVKKDYKDATAIGFYFGIDTLSHFDFIDFYSNSYKTYEEAELECLKKLIEIVKNKK